MPQTCLIAAHDPWFIQLLRVYSQESGFQVVLAYEAQDVLPMIYQEHPAAVLLQLDLPGQGKGKDLLAVLKKDPLVCQIPILVFSWQNNIGENDLMKNAAIYLQEPVTYETFIEALRTAGVC